MATIRIPTPLRAYTQGHERVNVGGATVQDALDDLVARYPDLKPHLFDNDRLRSFVNIFLDEDDVRYLQGVETTVEEDDQLIILPSIAGG